MLADVDHSMEVMREETFGPVLPLMTFKTDTEDDPTGERLPFG